MNLALGCRAVASDRIRFTFNIKSGFCETCKMITNRFLGLGGGQRGGRHAGSLSQKHLECGRIKVLQRKASPRRLERCGNRNILVGQDKFHADKLKELHKRKASIISPGLGDSSIPQEH